MTISGELEGINQLRAAIRESPATALAALGGAIYVEGERIMTEGSVPQVPVAKGTLCASHFVQLPVFTGTAVEVTLGYGGAAQAYALIQHERTDFNHRVGKDHYLSDPMHEAAPGLEARLAAQMTTHRLFPGVT